MSRVKKEEKKEQEGGREEEKQKERNNTEGRRGEGTGGGRGEDAPLKTLCPKDPGCIFHFCLLSIFFISRCHPPLHTAVFIQ